MNAFRNISNCLRAYLWIVPFYMLMGSCCQRSMETIEFFIATNGSPRNNGTKEHPFSSLEQARDAIRLYRERVKEHSNANFIVWIRGGIYELSHCFELTQLDSGTEFQSITYTAYPNERVIFVGGKYVSPRLIKRVNDAKVKDRLSDKKATDNIYEIDLKGIDISDSGTNEVSGFIRPYVNATLELIINDHPYHLSRYPNDSNIKLKPEDVIHMQGNPTGGNEGIRFSGNKLEQWNAARGVKLCGNFSYAWATDQLRVKKIDAINGIVTLSDTHLFGIHGDHEWNQYYYCNLLEELDYPGEYYVDNESRKLLFVPLKSLSDSDTIFVSTLVRPMFSLLGASYIHIRNLEFNASRGIGVYMERTESNTVENCHFKNQGVLAVCIGRGAVPLQTYKHPEAENQHVIHTMLSEYIGGLHEVMYECAIVNREGGKNNGIIHCKIENTGCGGISLGGGNRSTLEPAGNYVSDCEFTQCGRLDYTYKPPVDINGVGNRIQHCQFNPCPAIAIYVHGNNHLIEFNKIVGACNFMDDQGAIYLGRDPSEFGNIIRYNFFKDIGTPYGMTMAVYCDDGACGTKIYGNIFLRAGSKTIMIGGGRYNTIENNIFIQPSELAISLDNRLQNWSAGSIKPGGIFESRLNEMHYQKPPFSVQYPEMRSYFTDDPGLPKYNDIQNNVFLRVKTIYSGDSTWGPFHENNLIMDSDPGFVNFNEENLEMRKNAVVFSSLKDFKPIPFNKMGLYSAKNESK
jgi:hypothetical protein